jgi:hypothetical protein
MRTIEQPLHLIAHERSRRRAAEIDRMIAAGLRFSCVLADAGYALTAPFP